MWPCQLIFGAENSWSSPKDSLGPSFFFASPFFLYKHTPETHGFFIGDLHIFGPKKMGVLGLWWVHQTGWIKLTHQWIITTQSLPLNKATMNFPMSYHYIYYSHTIHYLKRSHFLANEYWIHELFKPAMIKTWCGMVIPHQGSIPWNGWVNPYGSTKKNSAHVLTMAPMYVIRHLHQNLHSLWV